MAFEKFDSIDITTFDRETIGIFEVAFEKRLHGSIRTEISRNLELTSSALSRFQALRTIGCPILVFDRPVLEEGHIANTYSQWGILLGPEFQPDPSVIDHTILHELGHVWWITQMPKDQIPDQRKAFAELVFGPDPNNPLLARLPSNYPIHPKVTNRVAEAFAEWFAYLVAKELKKLGFAYQNQNAATERLELVSPVSLEEFAAVGGPDLRLVSGSLDAQAQALAQEAE